MRVLIAPDKFKGSLTAAEVAAHIATGLHYAVPGVETDCCPIADGGDGTVDAAVAAGFAPVAVTVSGPTGEPVTATYARNGTTAVIELAMASGLQRLPDRRLAPCTASSRGTGELLTAALDAGTRNIVLGIGGSACTDGGAGMLEALGARLLTTDGSPVGPGGAGLPQVARVDLDGLHPSLEEAQLVVACDVDNPLLGDQGAAAMYGPQKGATSTDVAWLDAALEHWDQLLSRATGMRHADRAGAGAAGGVGYAALAALGGRLRPGIEIVLDLVGFEDRLVGADLVVTGEGSLDAQTLHGKGPAGVAATAARAGVPTVAIAGRIELDTDRLNQTQLTRAYALLDLDPVPDRCIARAGALLEATASRIAKDWALSHTD